MEAIRYIAGWRLLPLLLAGIINALIWCGVFLPHGPTRLSLAALIVATVAAGAATPKGLWWFSTVCICLPPLLTPNYHGALILHLVFGFFYPPVWIYFLMNFGPALIASTVLVLNGVRIPKTCSAALAACIR